jgi:aspartate/methionine/tyrosine aminotransferase
MQLDKQAVALNETIQTANRAVYELLSQRGKAIFFPKLGILSQSAEAAGKEINATIGIALEDDGGPMVLDSLGTLVQTSKNDGFSYAPSPGRPQFRSLWKEMMVKKNPGLAGKSFSHPVVTCALTHGLSMGGYLFIDDGDHLISPDRYWENYDLIFTNAYRGTISTFPMFNDTDQFNLAGLREQLLGTPVGKKIVMLNFPNNPTGYTVTESEAAELRALLIEAAEAGNTLVVFIDDAYFGLVYEEGVLQESIFSLLCDAHERILAVKFDGPTKEDYVWGFRVGFMTFGIKNGTSELYQALEAKLAGAIRGNISNASNIGQALLLSSYTSPSYADEKKEKYATLERRFRKIKTLLAEHPEYEEYFKPLPYNSGYFMCIRINSGDAEAVRKQLLEKYTTGTIAQNDLLRIAFSSTPLPLIETMFENCYQAAKECAG